MSQSPGCVIPLSLPRTELVVYILQSSGLLNRTVYSDSNVREKPGIGTKLRKAWSHRVSQMYILKVLVRRP